jgi:hypothetical protein
MVGVAGIYDFYRYVEARSIDMDADNSDTDEEEVNVDRRGPLFVGHNWSVRRAHPLSPKSHAVRVVRWWKPGVCGLRRRGYSGVTPFRNNMPDDMKEWIAPDVNNGVPLRFCGVSEFQRAKLNKTVSRWSIRSSCADVDLCVAVIQFRVARLRTEEHKDVFF